MHNLLLRDIPLKGLSRKGSPLKAIPFFFAGSIFLGAVFCGAVRAQGSAAQAGTTRSSASAASPGSLGSPASPASSSPIPSYGIVPWPLQSLQKPGLHLLKDRQVIYADDSNMATGLYLQGYLKDYYQLQWTIEPRKNYRGTGVLLATTKGASPESYSLDVEPGFIRIAGDGAGVFYGVQSLLQLIEGPVAGRSPATASGPVGPGARNGLLIPCQSIRDRPRFHWRGLSLDVSRHFFTVETVKKYLDLMAHYKLNTFHWHLTDDEGWRIQIDKYPGLTNKGSKMSRWAAEGKFRALSNITGGGNEGFFTKDEVRDVVAYARLRYITVLPEIEMPGHSEAAIYSYPELGVQDSTGETQQEKPIPRVGMYDPSERVFSFLEDVLTEVMELFPGKYIHIGGDEADMKKWLRSPVAVALMKREGLKSEKEVQSYFIKRMERFILSRGRQLVGWDEILEGGLAPSATVMSWRGEEGGIAAAKMHHPVVMTPLPYVYFDAPQSDDPTEPVGWNYPLSWQHVYSYEPVPSSLTTAEAAYVLGAQGNLWAEKIATKDHLEYMVYPRALALSEDCWTAGHQKDLRAFTRRLDHQYELLKLWGVNARLPDAEGLQFVSANSKTFTLQLSHPLRDAQIRYTLDGSVPDEHSALYSRPVPIDLTGKDSLRIRTLTTSSLSGQQRFQTVLLTHLPAIMPVAERPVLFPGSVYSISSSGMLAGASGISSSMSFPARGMPAVLREIRFRGFLKIDREDDYRLGVSSDGETVLTLGERQIVDNRGYHGAVDRESLLHLKKGLYPIGCWYKNEDDDARLIRFFLKTKTGEPVNISGMLFHDAE